MDVNAKIWPTKCEFVPRVAELPTCQNIRQYRALLSRLILLSDAVIRVEAVRKTKTPSGLPSASSVSVPVIWKVPSAESYVPGFRVDPPSSEEIRVTGVLPAASKYAVTRSSLAIDATESFRCKVPLMVAVSCPVKDVPGNSPTLPPASPLIVVVPVFVIVVPARTAKLDVVPRLTGACAAVTLAGIIQTIIKRNTNSEMRESIFVDFIISGPFTL